MNSRFRALIMHPDDEVGSSLEQCLSTLPSFLKANRETEIYAGLSHLAQDVSFDAVFLAASYGADTIFSFMLGAKETPVGEDCVYVAIIDDPNSPPEELFGIEHFIAAPFCEQALQHIITLSHKLKLENTRARLVESIQLMASMLVAEIDTVAKARKSGQSNRKISPHIVEACKTFHDLSPDLLDTYYELIGKAFTEAPPPGKKADSEASPEDHMRALLAQQYFQD